MVGQSDVDPIIRAIGGVMAVDGLDIDGFALLRWKAMQHSDWGRAVNHLP
jgi:hypothetical protein